MKRWKLFVLTALVIVLIVSTIAYVKERKSNLRVYFLDVGQGDAIYIRTPGGHDMLIDGGPSGIVLRRLSEVMPWYDRSVDVVVETHPDADHIGGLPDVLGRYQVGVFMEPGIDSDNAIDDEIARVRKARGVNQVVARRGQVVDFGDGSYFRILFPDIDVTDFKDTNDASVVGQMVFGSTSVMLTGDSPMAVENHLVETDGTGLQSTLLKAGHHGSRTSSGKEYVETVAPQWAIFSAGKDNRYGHPHAETVAIFQSLGIPMINTANVGTIRFVSDGKTFKHE
ncbi:MAG TPA: MBL fold metallo-hydrolase [Candidatus Paceibacterota bacterium]|jgi:Predicted hydrolase (metallo-beta-lactamase superfamily)